MADRQLKLPLNAKPVTRIVPARRDAAKRPMLATGNNQTAGGAAARPPVFLVRDDPGATRPQNEPK